MESNNVSQEQQTATTKLMLTKVIDGRTYLVNVYFAPSGETFEQKYQRMMRQDIMKQINQHE